jgi:phosphoribosyl 1,2-cyclic phosphate phosphodiesterase
MSLKLTILGCGSSGGVPRIGGGWGRCDPANPKNRRRRCSVLVERFGPDGVTRVLVDTSPDMREQMLSAEVPNLDAVWYTHEHADHTHGIDELRVFFLIQKQRVPVYADAVTTEMLRNRFAYCFADQNGYPAIAALKPMTAGVELTTSGAGRNITGLPFEVEHGNINALGFRWGNVAYVPDVNRLPDAAKAAISGLDVLIIDALRYTPHPSHFSLSETLAAIAEAKPKRAIITNMHIDLDFETMQRELPLGVEPAYDGMTIEFNNEA